MSKNKFKVTKKILAKEENQVDSRLYEIISKNAQINMLKSEVNNLLRGIIQYQTKLDQLKQQLEEKDIRIEELEGQFAYECECNKQLVDLQKQLAEKDKEEVVVTERGWAGHFCCANMCKFRRNTLLEYKDKKWVVSTVGAMPANKYSINKNKNGFTTIGLRRYYETMAFEAQKNGIYWDANVENDIDFDSNWALDECNFNSDQKANEMHDKVVEELIKKIKGE